MLAADRKMPPTRHGAAPESRGWRGQIARPTRPFSPLETMLSARKLRPARVRVLPGGQPCSDEIALRGPRARRPGADE